MEIEAEGQTAAYPSATSVPRLQIGLSDTSVSSCLGFFSLYRHDGTDLAVTTNTSGSPTVGRQEIVPAQTPPKDTDETKQIQGVN